MIITNVCISGNAEAAVQVAAAVVSLEWNCLINSAFTHPAVCLLTSRTRVFLFEVEDALLSENNNIIQEALRGAAFQISATATCALFFSWYPILES